jgi:hypothetical protein|tara:strand:+ start:635 stop:766 length:132 start_codon:yes stop_codon:yes gene_type:complete
MERPEEPTDEMIDLGDVNVETKGPLQQRVDEQGGISLLGLSAD